MTESAMSALLTTLGEFFTQCITWMGTLTTEIVDTPALVIFVLAMPVAGFVVGLLTRLFRVN